MGQSAISTRTEAMNAEAKRVSKALVEQLHTLLIGTDSAHEQEKTERVSTGCPALDQRLPHGGLRRGSLVEWLSDEPGCGAGVFALSAAREAQRDGGAILVVDRNGTFYPPAAAARRLNLTSLIVVHPTNERDEQWALDQALRCEHVAAVLAWPRRFDDRAFRRLQLAAETSGAMGLLLRPSSAEREPSWADVRMLVTPRSSPAGWRLGLRVLYCRGRFGRDEWEIDVEIDELTGDIHEARPGDLAAQLATAAAVRQQA
jgi:protein ImuA